MNARNGAKKQKNCATLRDLCGGFFERIFPKQKKHNRKKKKGRKEEGRKKGRRKEGKKERMNE